MGVSYLVFTLNEESAGWLRERGTDVKAAETRSRYPTLAELKETLSRLDGYTTEETTGGKSVDFEVVDARGYGHGWSATIWARTDDNDLSPPTAEDEVRITFPQGDPELVVMICEKLTRRCGPLVLIRDVDGRPLLVQEKVSAESLEAWLTD